MEGFIWAVMAQRKENKNAYFLKKQYGIWSLKTWYGLGSMAIKGSIPDEETDQAKIENVSVAYQH